MQDREQGFVAIHRKILSSPVYVAMSAEQQHVFLTMLLLANWTDHPAQLGRRWVTVHRGELAHSLETIAEMAGRVSIKVVRTTIARLMADDSDAGGNGPAVKVRWTGTPSGTGFRILSVVNYGRYQDLAMYRGTRSGTDRARSGHGPGTDRAPIKPREPREPREPPPPSPSAWTAEQQAAAVAVDVDRVWQLIQQARANRGRPTPDGLGWIPAPLDEEPARPARWTDWVRERAAEYLTDVEERLAAGYAVWLTDDDFAKKRWPTQLFLSPGIYRSRIPAARVTPENSAG